MKRLVRRQGELGFSLIELLVALGIFLVITGAAFTLLGSSQKRYQTDSQILTSFQEARLGVDQMVRDINDAGYPPPTFVGTDVTKFTKAHPNPQDAGSQVEWIRYKLQGTTLMRGAALKVSGDDPAVDTATFFVPFVQNVVNNSPTLQIGQFQLSAAYPNVFPSGNPVPIFTYFCDTPITNLPAPTLCSAALADNSPKNIRDVAITLIVASPLPDATTGKPRLVQLTARGHRLNPNQ